MEENQGFKFSKKTILALAVFVLVLVSIPLGTYLVQKSQIFKSRASELKTIINNQINQADQAKELKVAVIQFQFPNTTTAPVSKDAIKQVIFDGPNSVKKYFEEVSYGKLIINGDVFGPFTIPENPTALSCQSSGHKTDYRVWSKLADQEASKAGVILNQYPNQIYIFPKVESCNFAALGAVEGSQIWVNGSLEAGVVAYEFGHNLGLNHSLRLDCGNNIIDNQANCKNLDNDPYDLMRVTTDFISQSSPMTHLSAPYKQALGWLNGSAVQTVTQKGAYKIYPLENKNPDPRSLKIYKPDTKNYYYLEYRQPIGFDSYLFAKWTQGVEIRLWDGSSATPTKLIDVTGKKTWEPLSDGGVFEDKINKITIKQLAHDAESVTVEIEPSLTLPPVSFLTPWRLEPSLPDPHYNHALVAAPGNLFYVGGLLVLDPNSPPPQNQKVLSSKIDPNGNLGSWQENTPISYRYTGSAWGVSYQAQNENWLFVTTSEAVFRSLVHQDGSLGNWQKVLDWGKRFEDKRFPESIANGDAWAFPSGLLQAKGYLFLPTRAKIGVNAPIKLVTFSAKINPDGSLDSVKIANSLPDYVPISSASFGDYFYLAGVNNLNIKNALSPDVYFAKVNNDGTLSPWIKTTPLPYRRDGMQLIVLKGYLVAFAGLAPNREEKDVHAVYAAKINSDGSIGNWEKIGNFPKVLSAPTAATDGRNIFVSGGANYTEFQRNVYSATFSDTPTSEANIAVPIPPALVPVISSPSVTPTPTATPTSTPTPTAVPVTAAPTIKPTATLTQTPTIISTSAPQGLLAIFGDVNGDRKVDIIDLSALASKWGKSGATVGNADLNNDGIINQTDLDILIQKLTQLGII